jgi:hypothetical protein
MNLGAAVQFTIVVRSVADPDPVLFYRDAPDIRPDNPAFFDIRSDTGLHCRISGKAGYRKSG